MNIKVSNYQKKARLKLRIGIGVLSLLTTFLIWLLITLADKRALDEGFLQQRYYAEQAAAVLARKIYSLIETEEARPFDHYSFYTVTDSKDVWQQEALQRSPLSNLDITNTISGLVGYFQIEPNGSISSPLMPEGMSSENDIKYLGTSNFNQRKDKINAVEIALSEIDSSKRRELQQSAIVTNSIRQEAFFEKQQQTKKTETVAQSYDQRQLRSAASKAQAASKEVYQDLSEILVERGGNIDRLFSSKQKVARKDSGKLATLNQDYQVQSGNYGTRLSTKPSRPEVVTFEAEVDPLQVLSISSNKLVFFRKAWRNGSRVIQGFVVNSDSFFNTALNDMWLQSTLAPATNIVITDRDRPFIGMTIPAQNNSSYSGKDKDTAPSLKLISEAPRGENLIFNAVLPVPLQGFSIYYSLKTIPKPAGADLIYQVCLILAVVIILGLLFLYRLASTQIDLAAKQNDFVSAVSHELRTPLTSIRMYGEMLRNDWVPDEAKKKSYFDYIYFESERLSRLIANILRLARIEKGHSVVNLQDYSVNQLLDLIKNKVEQLVSAHGFILKLASDHEADKVIIKIDEDSVIQIIVNLVDNALKFAKDADRKEIHIGTLVEQAGQRLVLYVRDFGPGVPVAEQKKIFKLFYRSESELTRKTIGTGIGLALVKELAKEMQASVDYRTREPGAEFQLKFPLTNKSIND